MNGLHKADTTLSGLTATYMPRPRLDALFDQALYRSLTFVIAGTGYGKTQAVRHYVEQQQNMQQDAQDSQGNGVHATPQDAIVRWVQLSESDNIGSRLWENLTHTITTDNPKLARDLRELGFPETPARFAQFAELIRQSEHRTCKIFLVLDDFHLIHSPKALAFAERCAHLYIPNVYMIVISRSEPQLNIVALRSKGQISVITEEDLRFTEAETAEFFRKRKVSCSAQDISRIIKAAKGWAFAINILALILKRSPHQGRCSISHALEAMQQNSSQLFATEAWDNVSEVMQKALVKFSLLPDLPTAALQKLTDSVETLQDIPELASFVSFNSLTNDLAIHPLYLEFLQGKQHMLSSDEKAETYQRAAQWCSENDFYTDAMYCYAQSHQYERMIQTFLSYPFKLPCDTSEYFLQVLERLDGEGKEQDSPSILFLKSSFIPLMMIGAGRYEEARTYSLAILEKWQSADSPLATIILYTAYSNLAYIDMYTCTVTHVYDSPKYLRKSVEYFKQSDIAPAETTGTFINADIRSFACLVGEGASMAEFDQFLEAAKQAELYIQQTPYNVYAGYADLVACEYAFFKNQLDFARKYAHNAIAKAREKKQYSIVALAEKYLLRIATCEGDASLVKQILKQLQIHLDNPDFWNRHLYCDLYVGAFYARVGMPDQVPQWLRAESVESTEGEDATDSDPQSEARSEIQIPVQELYVSVLYHIAAKKYQQALTLLSNSYPREPQERFLFGELKLLLLTAVARIHTGDSAGAVADFEQAYQLSFCGELNMFFIELGKELSPLVTAALKQSDCTIPEQWLKETNRKAAIYAKKATVIAGTFQKGKCCKGSITLSEREKEILLDLYHGLSREEIAVHRYLSINTVKKALQSIYIKLGAHNNVDAVRIALEKDLIQR